MSCFVGVPMFLHVELDATLWATDDEEKDLKNAPRDSRYSGKPYDENIY